MYGTQKVRPRRPMIAYAVLAALLIAACSKGDAETAMLSGDEAILRVKPDAEKYAPDAFASLIERAAAARAAYDRGDYRAARELASNLPLRAEDVLQTAATTKDQMTARWNELRDTLPGELDFVARKLAALATMRRPPTFISQDKADQSRRQLAEASESWSAALRAFNDGDLLDAVARAGAADATARQLAALLEPVVLPPADTR